MKAILREKTCTLPVLVAMLTVGCFGLITSYAFAAESPSSIDEDAFLDPFALTTYQPAASEESSDEESLAETTLYEMAMSSSLFTTDRGTPISTWRPWIMIPYRPPIRSPFLPW